MAQYTSLARRIIGRFAPPNVKTMMLNSDDAISFVVHELMRGDWDYDPTRKTKLSSYRGRRGKWAIKVFLKRVSKGDTTVSLDRDNDEMMNDVAYHVNPINGMCNQESRQYVESLLDHLTGRQRQCIVMFYFDNMRPADIARVLNIRRQAVQNTIDRALKRLQSAAEGKTDD